MEECAEGVECVGLDPVVDPGAAAFAVDEAGFAEGLEVVADGGSGELEVGGEFAHADFGLAGDESGEAEADGVTEGFEHGCDPCGFGFVDGGGA